MYVRTQNLKNTFLLLYITHIRRIKPKNKQMPDSSGPNRNCNSWLSVSQDNTLPIVSSQTSLYSYMAVTHSCSHRKWILKWIHITTLMTMWLSHNKLFDVSKMYQQFEKCCVCFIRWSFPCQTFIYVSLFTGNC